ncbi:MAG: winged helix-turn-helix transcriptional regulator [Bdellovibrionales bacterium]|jgi:DNA-binding transcriptional ArsR family regulator|nr:winged helix-turn-helix transcriptional regulator [Bdellovibrionales bacterium]
MMKRKTGKSAQAGTLYELQAEICSALANPVRLHILDLLSGGNKTSTDLLKDLEIPKANLSQHLAVLKDAGIIRARKEGQFQILSLSMTKIKDACSIVRAVLVERMANEEKKNSELIKELRAQK